MTPASPADLAITVRDARPGDLETIVAFNAAMAIETEGKVLNQAILREGVRQALRDPDRLRYWVAESGDRVVGQAAITREWSDWRNGWLWWLQSVYVVPEHRGRGAFRAIHVRIREEARSVPEVIGLRLYVEQANRQAQQTYQSLGMQPGGYLVFEELWKERFNRSPD